MKKIILTIIPFLYYGANAIAQSITPIVFSSAENFVTHTNFSVSSTLGDFMVQTFTRTQTTNNSTVQLQSLEKDEASISIYPNPSFGTFYMNISGSKNKEVLIVVRDAVMPSGVISKFEDLRFEPAPKQEKIITAPVKEMFKPVTAPEKPVRKIEHK